MDPHHCVCMCVCVCPGYMLAACSCEGSAACPTQPSLMPLHPGWSPDGITGNWIVFHLLGKRPERDAPRLSPPSTCTFLLPFHPLPHCHPTPLVNPCSHPITEVCHTEPPSFHMSSKVSPCDAESLGRMSAECSIKQLPAQSRRRRRRRQWRDPVLCGASP